MFQKALITLSVIPIFFAVLATETNGTNWYLVNTTLSIIAIIISVLLFSKKKIVEVCIFDLIIPSLLIYAFLQHAFKGLNMYYITLYLSLLIYSVSFLLYRNLFKENISYAIQVIIYNVLAITIWQYFKITSFLIKGEDITTYITNSFGNTGIFAIFLSLVCSFCYSSFLLSKSKLEKLFYIFIGLVNIVLIIYLNSRTALVVVLLFTLMQLATSYFKTKKLNLHWIKFLVGVILVFVFSISYKQSSSNGRLLIWKASLNMAKDYFPFGSGFNTFPSTYPFYQAEYFSNGKMTNQEMFLADSTITAFNEPLQVLCELGLIGFFLFLFILWRVFSMNDAEIDKIRYALFGLFFASIFYYVFHSTLLFLAAIVMLSIFFANIKPILRIKGLWVSLLSIFITAVSICFIYIFNTKIQSIKILESASKHTVSLAEFENLNKHLSDNPVFLYMYANELYNKNQPHKSIHELKKLENYVIWYNSEILAGDCYSMINEQIEAEQHFIRAVSICPGKFIARHKLLNFYINNNNKAKALKTAVDIINLPEKIPSGVTLAIKLEAESYLRINNNK